MFPGPEMPLAGMRWRDGRPVRGVVSWLALGDARGADRPATRPNQPTRDQAEDVEMEEETTRASPSSAADENLCRYSSYHMLNGIGAKRVGRIMAPSPMGDRSSFSIGRRGPINKVMRPSTRSPKPLSLARLAGAARGRAMPERPTAASI